MTLTFQCQALWSALKIPAVFCDSIHNRCDSESISNRERGSIYKIFTCLGEKKRECLAAFPLFQAQTFCFAVLGKPGNRRRHLMNLSLCKKNRKTHLSPITSGTCACLGFFFRVAQLFPSLSAPWYLGIIYLSLQRCTSFLTGLRL